jgi:hypothetical protein
MTVTLKLAINGHSSKWVGQLPEWIGRGLPGLIANTATENKLDIVIQETTFFKYIPILQNYHVQCIFPQTKVAFQREEKIIEEEDIILSSIKNTK